MYYFIIILIKKAISLWYLLRKFYRSRALAPHPVDFVFTANAIILSGALLIRLKNAQLKGESLCHFLVGFSYVNMLDI